jgi:hypothetical protein
MATVRIVTAVFGGEPYARFALVFRASCRQAMPGVRFSTVKGRTPVDDGRPWDCRMNTEKLRLWMEAAERWPRENLVLADCDMLAVGDVTHVFEDHGFDIGYTARSESLPLNGGILFIRPTRAARRWLAALARINAAMRRDPAFHAPYRDRYHGMNQAAMGFLLEQPIASVRVRAFPCRRYNAVGLDDWRKMGPETVFVHVKSSLRKVVLGRPVSRSESAACAEAAALWRAVEAAA